MRTFLLLLHLVGMAAFLGVLLVNARIKKVAETSGDEGLLRFAYDLVRRNDARIGGPGFGLLLVGGLGLAGMWGGAVARPWFFTSMALLVPMFLGWMGMMLPAQVKLTKLEDLGSLVRQNLSRRWDMGWWITVLSLLAITFLMIGKDALGMP